MARSEQAKVIDGLKFTVTMLPPKEAHRLLVRTLKAIAPAAAAISTSFDSVGELMREVQAAKLAAAGIMGDDEKKDEKKPKANLAWVDGIVQQVAASLDEALLDDIIEALRKKTLVTTEKGTAPLSEVFDAIFQGEMKLMYQWLFFAWQVQYADFFDSLKSMRKT